MALRYMEENYMKQISLEEISQYVGISPQHFSKIFKEETGLNYIDWLTNLRIESAKKMLLTEKSTVKEVCYMVGYNDPNYFSRIFKKIEGVSPTEYISETLLSQESSS
jgi:two-component system response regulator YesN